MDWGGAFSLPVPGGMPTLPNLIGPEAAGGTLAQGGVIKLPSMLPAPPQGLPIGPASPMVQFPTVPATPPEPSKIGNLNPLQYSIARSIAEQQGTRADVESFINAALQGKTPEQHEAEQNAAAQAQAEATANAELQTKATAIANDTAHLDDNQFQNFLKMYQDELQSTGGPRPELGNPQAPSIPQMLFATAGAFLNPKHAFEIGATPFQAQLNKWQQDYTQHLAAYQDEGKSHQERLAALHGMIQILDQRDLQAKDLALKDKEIASREKISGVNAAAKVSAAEIAAGSKAALQLLKGGQADDKVTLQAFYNGKSYDIRHAARLGWAMKHNGEDLGEAAPATPAELNQSAGAELKGAQTGLTEAKTQTESELRAGRVKLQQDLSAKYQAETGLDKKRADNLAAHTATWPAEAQAKVAQGWATVQNLNSEVLSRKFGDDIKGKRFSMDQVQQQMEMITKPAHDALQMIHLQNSDLLGKVQELQKTLTGDDDHDKPVNKEIDALNKQMTDNSTHYGQLQKDLQDGQTKIRKTAVDELRSQAKAAIGKGAKAADVKARFKQMTGEAL